MPPRGPTESESTIVPTISCSFPPEPETPEHIALAEELGYTNAWCYDTPALQLDAWMTLARAADRTSRIGLGTAVLIPSMRHVMTTASAIATLVALAPGRTRIGIGTGFTGRLAMGKRPLTLATVGNYARQLRGLLRGERVEVDGALTEMLHGPGHAPPRPIEVPMLLGIGGPKGEALAREEFDGVLTPVPWSGFDQSGMIALGTVLDEGESFDDDRVLSAAGAGAALMLHSGYEQALYHGSDQVQGTQEWRSAIEAIPIEERHLHTHVGHVTALNTLDQRVVDGALVEQLTLSGTPSVVQNKVSELGSAGVTEVIYQPSGPDVERELTAFARAVGLSDGAS